MRHGEKSVQAHGLVLSVSPNYLDQCVLRFRAGGFTNLAWGTGSCFPTTAVSVVQVTMKHLQA